MIGVAESALLKVGTAVASTALRRWAGPRLASMRAPLTVDRILVHEFPRLRDRRRVQRQFDQIAEEVAERLSDYFRLEFAGLDPNEVEAAANAVSATLDDAALSLDVLLTADLDPVSLERAVRATRPHAAEDEYLGPAGTELYNVTLREACNYVVEVAVTLPEFGSRAARELLRRETELIALVSEVLDRLPKGESATEVGATLSEKFEQQFRREVARKFDRLELFGVDLTEVRRRYALTVAYVSLAVSSEHVTSGRSNARAGAPSSDVTPEGYLRVDQALARGRRHLIRGEAGSGKTTLLYWLAVQSARRAYHDPLKEWNETLPFLIPLRRYAAATLPRPKDFVSHMAGTLADDLPGGWVQMHLEDGRALVLVDGLDELPARRREEVHGWLEELCNVYERSRYVVTTRPSAVAEGWLAPEGFSESELQPMTPRDVRSFIAYWHRAAKDEVDANPSELDELETRLAAAVRETPHLAALATNPLLCAMLCALYRDRRARLPRYRTELYRIALETLLERRDTARDIPTALSALDVSEKELILQDLAWWLLGNSKSVIPKAEAVARVTKRLQALPHVDADPAALLDELVIRAGVLREPVVGQLDFVHKTFQEYFAAAEVIDQDVVQLLIERATTDDWREIVVLAAGLIRGARRDEFLEGLLARARREPEVSTALQLLAVECLQSVPQLSDTLARQIRDALEGLVPPRTSEAARSLSSAGDSLVPILARYVGATADIVSACVRCLGYIGSKRALAALAAFGTDPRPDVIKVLLETWARFDPERYASDVLQDSPLIDGQLLIHDTALLKPSRHLQRLRSLECVIPGSVPPREALEGTRKLSRLVVGDARGLQDLAEIGQHPQLKALELQRATDLGRVGPVDGMPALERLVLGQAHSVKGIDRISKAAPGLRCLTLTEAESLDDVGGLSGLEALSSLTIQGARLRSLDALSSARSLAELEINDCPTLTNIAALASLRYVARLSLAGCSKVGDVSSLGGLLHLRELDLSECRGVNDLHPFVTIDSLKSLSLRGCGHVHDISVLSDAVTLRYCDLSGTIVTELAPLRKMLNLKRLSLASAPVADVSALSSIPTLVELSLHGCRRVTNIDPLRACVNLEMIDLVECNSVRDFAPLMTLPKLQTVRVSQQALDAFAVFESIDSLTRLDLHGGVGNFNMAPLSDRGVVVRSIRA